MTQISVAVVDGQRTFADALADRLAAEPGMLVVAAVESAAALRRSLVGRHADIVLLDSSLPEAIELAAELARARAPTSSGATSSGATSSGATSSGATSSGATSPAARVIMLGTLPDAAYIVDAFHAGVAGWVQKEESIEHLLDAIRGVIRGETQLPAAVVGPVLRLLLEERDEQHVSRRYPLAALTPREREVLLHLAEGIGRREVAERMHLSAHTVRSHLQNLMGKLGVHTTLEAVALARRAQLREIPPRAASLS
jgi:DNA-binding NarL/FixJ family response regulator